MSSLKVPNNSLLNYRKQFYIQNPILFLNCTHYFYYFFLVHLHEEYFSIFYSFYVLTPLDLDWYA